MTTRVLIADDHAVVRQGLERILEETQDIVVEDQAGSAEEVLRKAMEKDYDVIVLDLIMPGSSGLEVLKQLLILKPHTSILVLSFHPEDQYALRVLKDGGAGYLTKESAADEIVRAIRKVSQGGKYVSPHLAEQLAAELQLDSERAPHERLSDREYEVLCLIASGKTVTEIAGELSLSAKTVSTYRGRILGKMNMKTSAELTHYAVHNGLVE